MPAMKYTFLAVLLGLCLAAASVPAMAQATPQVKLGKGTVSGGGVFSTGGGITVVVEAHDIANVPHLCGVWARSQVLSGYVEPHVRRALTNGVVQSGGMTVLRDLRVFAQVPAAQSYLGAQATCVPIARSASPIRVRLPNRVLIRDRGDASSVQISFKSSQKANPAFNHSSIQHWLLAKIAEGNAAPE